MKVYIAGKISGEQCYWQKFEEAAERAGDMFGTVLNPAMLPDGMTAEDYMSICIQMIFRADAVLFLPDWKESDGARLEHQLCKYIGKPVLYLE